MTIETYWHGKGTYQKEARLCWDELVPEVGAAKTVRGEVLRGIGRLEHEYFNNGNLNAYEYEVGEEEVECWICNGGDVFDDENECAGCGGEGYVYDEYICEEKISDMFAGFLDLIEKYVPNSEEAVQKVREIILANLYLDNKLNFSEKNQTAYKNLSDLVVKWVIDNPDFDEKLPD